MADFIIAHLYPELMNLYGDRGNIICLQKRLEWRGYNSYIEAISPGCQIEFNQYDMIFMGAGSDREQKLVVNELVHNCSDLKLEIEQGLPALFVGGAYQLLGKYYESSDGVQMPGLNLLDFYTQREQNRLIGNIVLAASLHGQPFTVAGFENHAGRTYLEDKEIKALGRVISGFGNNGEDEQEGIWYKNLIATYLHGPLLPKNPILADYFIEVMMNRKGITFASRLDDHIENFAHEQIKKKVLG
ncbi:MAG: glutamine amidotransferase [Syntrophomonadaceae bacterium]|nr:glutamine amidotransferase [Syntrophomonadaceae bacterium]